jgi:hypothetical protein
MRVHVEDQNNSQNQDTKDGGQFTVTGPAQITFTYPIPSSNVNFTIGYDIQNPNLAGPLPSPPPFFFTLHKCRSAPAEWS